MKNILTRYKAWAIILTVVVILSSLINSLLESYNQRMNSQIQKLKKVNQELKNYSDKLNKLNGVDIDLKTYSLAVAKYDIFKFLDNLSKKFPININEIKVEQNRIYTDFSIELNSISKNDMKYILTLLSSKQPYFFINNINIENKDEGTKIKISGTVENVYSN